MEKVIRIGCHSAFWGDSPTAAWQLVHMGGKLDYLVSDYLAEVTMGILARSKTAGARGNAGEGGFIAEFAKTVWAPLMKEIIARKIKVVTNAGGMNPEGLKAAIEKLTREAGLEVPVVAAVVGDDITSLAEQYRKSGVLRTFEVEGEKEEIGKGELPLMSLNAYLGAFPIARALAQGAQVVITGRCVDSAITLGPLIHEFGWGETDYDLLSAGSLAGHVIECGCQATGGNFTDWEDSHNAGWVNVGFPIVECKRDGSFVVTKPAKTGGIVTRATVAEQMLYEIGDPAAYILPDVVCDWRYVKIADVAPEAGQERSNRVLVQGARGRPPTATYKVSGTYFDGYKITGELLIGGRDAARKAQAVGESVLAKASLILARRKLPDFTATNIEVLGAEHTYGPHSRTQNSREVVLRLGAIHSEPTALLLLATEFAPAATSMAPGITGGGSGRPRPTPLINHFACLIDKEKVPVTLKIGDREEKVPIARPPAGPHVAAATVCSGPARAPAFTGKLVSAVLIDLCFGRSGDKGDIANIGIFARQERFYPFLKQILTEEAVHKYMAHLCKGRVRRYELPGISGFNFVLTKALGGGGLVSLNIDRQGKTYAQQLLELPVSVPADWVKQASGKAKL